MDCLGPTRSSRVRTAAKSGDVDDDGDSGFGNAVSSSISISVSITSTPVEVTARARAPTTFRGAAGIKMEARTRIELVYTDLQSEN